MRTVRGARLFRSATALLAAAWGAILGPAIVGGGGSVCFAQPASRRYPALGSLGPDDIIFAQQQEQLVASYAALRNHAALPDLVVYSYTARATVDLISLAARLNLPYETLATMNRLDRSRSFLAGERILVPGAPGLFAPLSPGSDLDLLMSYRDMGAGRVVSLDSGPDRTPARLLFFPGARFNPEERALFLGLLVRFPLPSALIRSGFGMRASSIARRESSSAGIELAAPLGTEVYAARDGVVSDTGVDVALGQYIVIAHEGNWSTVYGHLSARRVRLYEAVQSGMIVGNVGATGESAGPRLRFEVRGLGEAVDPAPLSPRIKEEGN
jgi:murein DD-endopeptidase MepM/ murein hydrolase activator NlpD